MVHGVSWQAVTHDGAVIEQGEVAYTDLLKKNLREFRLIDRRTGFCTQCHSPVIGPRVLLRVRLDPSKVLICRRRPPFPNLTSTKKADVVWLVGWQQTLLNFTDVQGNPAVVLNLLVLNERTGEVHSIDHYIPDVAAGTHAPELFPAEIEAGLKSTVIENGDLAGVIHDA